MKNREELLCTNCGRLSDAEVKFYKLQPEEESDRRVVCRSCRDTIALNNRHERQQAYEKAKAEKREEWLKIYKRSDEKKALDKKLSVANGRLRRRTIFIFVMFFIWGVSSAVRR